MLFLRLTILLLLLVAAWNPNMPFGKPPVDVFMLVDDSFSMVGRFNPKIRAQLLSQLQELPPRSRLCLIRYAKQPVLEIPLTAIDQLDTTVFLDARTLWRLPLDRTASNLESALWLTSRLITPEHPAKLLIIHDDQQNTGDAGPLLKKLEQQGYGLMQINLSSTNISPDVWVQRLDVPVYAEAGQQIDASVTLGSNAAVTAKLMVSVNGSSQHQESVQLQANSLKTLALPLNSCNQEVCLVKAELKTEVEDAVSQNNSRQEAVTVDTTKPVLYLLRQGSPSPFLAGLLSGHYPVKSLAPELCITGAAELRAYQTMVIDDLAIQDMQAVCWSAIDKAVRQQGMGLIVLGGPNSFSVGAYRHSLLENLLPVTAEAAKQQENAALLFLVDKSGSMDKGDISHSAMARQAVIETLKLQTGLDRFGLISFDAQPHLTIPIQQYSDPAGLVAEKFNDQASGGTQLKPALDFAIETLETVDSKKRLLVLVTDGFLEEQDLAAVEQKILAQNLDLIILAIGNDARTDNLKHLVDNGHGKLLHVDKIAELPLLMRKSIEEDRLPAATGKIKVIPVRPLPFMRADTSWPGLYGYMLTMPKPDSSVFLQSQLHDPLLVVGNAGQGKVIALPAGLDAWARDWWSNWREWGRFAGGLIHWANANRHHPQLHLRIRNASELELDAVTADQDWYSLDSGKLTISQTNGQIATQSLSLTAPGQYNSVLELQTQGLYKISVSLGELGAYQNIFYNADQEYIPHLENDRLSLSNSIKNWRSDTVVNPFEAKASSHARNHFSLTALVLYLLTFRKWRLITGSGKMASKFTGF